METNDDELDKLIQETQDIWKSLKNSGVEIKNSDIDDTTNNDTNLDDLDNIATKLDHSTLNIINTNNTNTNISHSNIEDDRSRLNLATPSSELSSLLMTEVPSKLSQIPFSTPNANISSTIISALPDTPFLFSPSLPKHSVQNDFTLSSPINSHDNTKTKKIDSIDFSEECWHQINQMLSKSGFPALMKQHNDNFEEISPKHMICNRFKEILITYCQLQNDTSDHQMLKKRLKDLNLQNKELKNQLHISSEKMNDLKQEMTVIKHKKVEMDHRNDDILINVKRQLEHCKNIINKKNDEITKIKQKLQQNIQKDTIRRENVESIFQSINKRNSRKNNKKDQQQLDVMEMYQEERKKMQNEIKLLRKEIRNLNQKLIEQKEEQYENKTAQRKQNKQKKKRWNISFTPSSKQPSDDDAVVVDLKWKTRNEIKKQIQNIDDIERAKDLNRLETQKLRETLDEIYREKEELESSLHESKKENKSLTVELEKRPSYTEWTRLRKELNVMNKELMETKKVASLRKYMDTRELIKRDKDIHSLKLTQIESLPTEIMKEILQDLCRILSIKDITILVANVKKLTKCVECVPILEQYISKIVRVLMASDHAPELIKISKISPKNVFDQVIPILKQWIIKLDKVDALTTFRAKTDTILKKRTIYKNNIINNKNNNINPLQLHEIVKQIQELVESEEYLLNSKECFNNAQKDLISNPNDLCNRIIRHFQHIFSIQNIEGVFPKMNQIYLELNEMRNVLKTIKSILGLPQNSAVNLCFKELQKVIDQSNDASNKLSTIVDGNKENSRTDNPSVITKWNGILIEIQSLLQCTNEDEIVIQCKELIDRCKEYDAVFPRVHNLVNQLRTTLNVEFAHQILPKVKDLVSNV